MSSPVWRHRRVLLGGGCLAFLVARQWVAQRERAPDGLMATSSSWDRLVARTTRVTSHVMWWSCVLYLASEHVSWTLCDGHSIAAAVLARFSLYLTEHERYRLALKMRHAAKWCDKWLLDAPALRVHDEATALLYGLNGQHTKALALGLRMSSSRFEERRARVLHSVARLRDMMRRIRSPPEHS